MSSLRCLIAAALLTAPLAWVGAVAAQDPPPRKSSFSPVVPKEDFASVMRRMSGDKAGLLQKHKSLLAERYDLADQPVRRRDDVPRQAGPGRRAREAARRRDLGRSSRP